MDFRHLILLLMFFSTHFSTNVFVNPPIIFILFFSPPCSVFSSITVLCTFLTWLFPSACCITLSQPNGITGEHVSLSLLSATPPLIARKLMKRRTWTTPSTFRFWPIVSFISFALTPFFKNLFPAVPVEFFPWLGYFFFSPFLVFGSASWHKSFIILSFRDLSYFGIFQPHFTTSVSPPNPTCLYSQTPSASNSPAFTSEGLNAKSSGGSVR